MSTLNLKNAMNSKLPKDIQIFKSEIVNNDFHSRFSAKEREYIYRIKKELQNHDSLIDTIYTCHTTVGKAILTTSLTIAFGFSVLLLSVKSILY